MSNLFVTSIIGYETRGPSDDPATTGNSITRTPFAVRWDVVTAINALAHPNVCYDNESVTEPVSVLATKYGSYHICCAFEDALRQWQAWEVSTNTYKLASN